MAYPNQNQNQGTQPQYQQPPQNQGTQPQYQQPPMYQYTYAYQYQTIPKKPHRLFPDASTTDKIFALIALILGVVTIDYTFFGMFNLGFTITFSLWALLGGVYLLNAKKKLTPYSVFCAVAAVALSVTFAIYDDGFSKFLMVMAIIVLSAITLLSVSRQNKNGEGNFRYIGDILKSVFVVPFENIGQMVSSIFSINSEPVLDENGNPIKKKRKISNSVIGGIACSIPVLMIIIPLLMDADEAFERMIKTVFGDFSRIITSVILGIGLFILLFSALMYYKYHGKKTTVQNGIAKSKSILPTAGINTFLTIIGAVYLVYLFSQLNYFWGGFLGNLPEEYSYAEYAVRGFFELCVISLVNMGLIFLTVLFSHRNGGKVNRSTAFIELFICLFSLFIISTGIAKMVMYIGIYGMTKLRVLTSVFMIMLACLFVIIIIRLFITKFPYFKAAVVAVTVIGVAVSFVNIDTAIAKYNINAYQSGKIEEMDVKTLCDLSPAAIPQVVRLLNDKDKTVAEDAAKELSYYAVYRLNFVHSNLGISIPKSRKSIDFREYNYSDISAYNAITNNLDKINSLINTNDLFY